MNPSSPSSDAHSEAVYLPTPTQEGMIFQALFSPAQDLNYEQLVVRGVEASDAALWHQAWQRAYDLAPALRCYFAWEGVEHPTLMIAPPGPIEWAQIECASSELEDWLEQDRQRRWDLSQAPLMRVTWVTLRGVGEAILVWSFHHILLDGRSIAGILEAVQQLVNALRQGDPEPRFKQADYATLLRALAQRDKVADREFWREYLDGWDTVNDLPGLYAEQNPDIDPRLIDFVNDGPSVKRIETAAKAHGLTRGTLVQTAWALIVARTTNADDVVFGVARAGRHFHPHAMFGLGMFMTTVPMRCQVDPETPVLQWLKAFRTGTLGVREHEHYSLAEIQTLTPIPSGIDLFSSLLVIERDYLYQAKKAKDAQWATRAVELRENAGYPLVLTSHEAPDGSLRATLTIDPTWVEPAAAKRALDRFQQVMWSLLEVLEGSAEATVGDLEWLPEPERAALSALHPNPIAPPRATVDELFHQRAQLVPQRIAVVAGAETISYAELEAQSNRLAHWLVQAGVKPGDTVAVCLDRGVQLVVALLASLKAGAAYMPLDRLFPKARLAKMLEAARPRKVLTLARLRTSLPSLDESVPVHLDELSGHLSRMPNDPPDHRHTPSSPCYVVFTSGTTGDPKGVVTTHGNLTSIYQSWAHTYRLEEHLSHLQMANVAFDVFSGDFARALLSGGKLVLCEPERLLDPPRLVELIHAQKIDIAEFVPLVLRTLIDHMQVEGVKLPSLKTVIAGSDVWYVSEYKHFAHVLGNQVRLVNSYGITECTIDSTYFDPASELDGADRVLPIGIPFNNSSVRVVDERGCDAGFYQTGELWIGGFGVTGGYLALGEPDERTLQKFVTDARGNTWYKTGDLARLREDGVLELVGRADSQVKVQGFRVELGEVEAALKRDSSVANCAVIAREGARGERFLVAYVVPKKAESLNIEELRAATQARVPYYMVPRSYVQLAELPRTRNGKIDRKALPEPEMVQDQVLRQTYEAPETPLEQRIAAIWSDLLNVPRVGRHDNFFELGGHSLLAVRLFARINQFADPKLPLAALVNAQTVAHMAALIESGSDGWTGVIPLRDGPDDKPPLFWIHTLGGGGGGGFFRYQQLCNLMTEPRKCYGIQAPRTPLRRIEDMAEHYCSLIQRIQPKGPYHIFGYCFGGTVAYEIARQFRLEGETVGVVGLIDAEARVEVPAPRSLRAFWDLLVNVWLWIFRFVRRDWRTNVEWFTHRLFPMLAGVLRGNLERLEYRLEDFMETHEQAPENRPYVEAHWAAATHYQPEPYEGKIMLMRSKYQPLLQYQRALGWESLCQNVEVHILPCGHGELLELPHIQGIAQLFETELLTVESELFNGRGSVVSRVTAPQLDDEARGQSDVA